MELQLRQQGNHIPPLVLPETARLRIQRHRRLPVDGSQKAILKGVLPVSGQAVMHPLLPDFVQVFVNPFQRPVAGQQVDGRLVAHARHAGDVVRLVPHQRLVIGLLRGG